MLNSPAEPPCCLDRFKGSATIRRGDWSDSTVPFSVAGDVAAILVGWDIDSEETIPSELHWYQKRKTLCNTPDDLRLSRKREAKPKNITEPM